MIIEPTKEQSNIISDIISQMHYANFHLPYDFRDTFVTKVVGYAGTGKTTLLACLRKEIYKAYSNLSIAFVTYTGKAASVLKSKLEENYVNTSLDYIGTIHGLIYKPETKYDNKLKAFVITGWKLKKRDELYHDLIIIDEGSMVSEKIWKDLQKFNCPIIVVGDHGQLPPVGDNFNLLKNPSFELKTIHRQALNSPIIKLSQFVRYNGFIPFNRMFSQDVFKLSWEHSICQDLWKNKVVFDESLVVLCGFNATRNKLNEMIRTKLDYTGNVPAPGERLICLKNDHQAGVMNGQQSTLVWLMPHHHVQNVYRMTMEIDNQAELLELNVSNKCFGQVSYNMIYEEDYKLKKEWKKITGEGNLNYFDFGYATSVHKSQGSEWEKVILFEQRAKTWDDVYYARWLYTAITRAKSKLFIISDAWI